MCVSLAILGTLMSANSAIQEGNAQAAAYSQQAQQADQNAKTSERQAVISAQNGAQEEQRVRNRASAVAGSQKAGYSASGLDIGQGSPLDVLTETNTQGNLDALATRTNAANQTWGYQAEQTNYQNQANQARAAASNAKSAAKMNAFGTLLSGATSMNKMYGKRGK
jgi:hypothetical protein